MAQRLLHYLIGERLLEGELARYSAQDAARFRFGNLLPDAYPPGRADELRRVTHFIVRTGENMDGRYSDFELMRRMFAELIPKDPLYLGYYLHLVSDACHRRLFYASVAGEFERSLENVSFLHRDYRILNTLIVEEYGLGAVRLFRVPLESEPITAVAPFDAEGLYSAFEGDITGSVKGELRFLSPDFSERFVEYALPVCTDAYRRLIAGEPIPSESLSWSVGKKQ